MAAEERIFKHLEFIQATISRKAQNSFAYKGWAITLVSAIIALSQSNNSSGYLAALVPLAGFWVLDAYSLRQERLFRCLYDQIRNRQDTDFCMNTAPFNTTVAPHWRVAISKSILWFYLPSAVLLLTVYFIKHHT